WEPPSAAAKGWHKDGDFFVHFLDSPEQGLLTLVLWSDLRHQGGGTFIVADSVPAVARFLADHPEGVRPGQFDYPRILSECRAYIEMTGEVGDVVLLHPYMLHASSQNVSGVPRFLTNPAVHLN
ncbi:MAG: phytanoyl-CoA dioxygenase family protein, partial [Armatimonadetes bacterium]|nr:phytanoyl-CoA dioxygenase family protein [Armatimonadota bacterium]